MKPMRVTVFFFFQAEDGIRVIGVTGVQTCALPISLEYSGRGRCIRVSYAEPQCFHSAATCSADFTQIGRASCRERVEISVAAVAFTNRRKDVNKEKMNSLTEPTITTDVSVAIHIAR